MPHTDGDETSSRREFRNRPRPSSQDNIDLHVQGISEFHYRLKLRIAKEAFDKKIQLLTSKLNIELTKKKTIRYYVWRIDLYGPSSTGTVNIENDAHGIEKLLLKKKKKPSKLNKFLHSEVNLLIQHNYYSARSRLTKQQPIFMLSVAYFDNLPFHV